MHLINGDSYCSSMLDISTFPSMCRIILSRAVQLDLFPRSCHFSTQWLQLYQTMTHHMELDIPDWKVHAIEWGDGAQSCWFLVSVDTMTLTASLPCHLQRYLSMLHFLVKLYHMPVRVIQQRLSPIQMFLPNLITMTLYILFAIWT